MVNPDNTVFLRDILAACDNISDFVGDMKYESFTGDKKTISAVLRELSVIGEAARKVTDDFRENHSEIPWEKIFGMRNKLIHDYMGVQLPIVWQTVQDDIPLLKNLVSSSLGL